MAEPITDEGGEETGVPRENPRRRASEKVEVAVIVRVVTVAAAAVSVCVVAVAV